jgi:antitoxin ParD1/3/4
MLGINPWRFAMNVSLTPELEKLVEDKVQSGRYQSASEVIREGLRLLEDQDRLREMRLEEVRRKIQAGLNEFDRGEGIDEETVFAELKQKSEALRKTRRGE